MGRAAAPFPSPVLCSFCISIARAVVKCPAAGGGAGWGGAVADDRIDGNDLGDGAAAGIGNAELAAVGAAVAHGDDQLEIGGGVVGAFECGLHMPGDRAGDQEQVGMAR
jgi:hypothetical protein